MRVEEASKQEYDVCVIGSGPAGIIVALEYTRLNPQKNLLLLEFGYKGQPLRNSLDDSINIKNTINHHDPYECTNKGIGGTSATWGGRCVMYDDVDFRDRPIIQGGCTWNISLFNELSRYTSQAAHYFECGSSTFSLKNNSNLREQRIAEGFNEGVVTDSVLERWSMPTRFGERYAKDIEKRANLTFVEAGEVRDFSLPDKDGNTQKILVRDVISGQTFQITAKKYVLAAGTQETTRILLRNPQLFHNLGKIPAALGKYYQGHLSGKIASVKFSGNPTKTDYGFLRDSDGTYMRRRFQFTPDFLIKNDLLNTAIWLDNPLYFDPKHRSGAMSFMYLAMIMPVLGKKLAPPAIAHSITKGKVYGISKHIWNVIRSLPESLSTPASIFYKRYCVKRKLPGVFLFSPENRYALHFHAEQIPVYTNRMELAPDGETLNIYYEITDEDVKSVIKLHEVLDQWLRKCECGDLEYWYSKDELAQAIKNMSKDGIHQSGTTRIADSSEDGVVDSNLKVWGTNNVYVCSSSVFPTSGQANPTFLLGAFAVRLAEQLSSTNEKS